MLRRLTIDAKLWQDERFRSMNDDGKLVFLFLLTHPDMTALGAMRASIGGLADELGWSIRKFRRATEQVFSRGMVEFDADHGWLCVPDFLRHQEPERPTWIAKRWVEALRELPECPGKQRLIARCRDYLSAKSPRYLRSVGARALEAFGVPMPTESPRGSASPPSGSASPPSSSSRQEEREKAPPLTLPLTVPPGEFAAREGEGGGGVERGGVEGRGLERGDVEGGDGAEEGWRAAAAARRSDRKAARPSPRARIRYDPDRVEIVGIEAGDLALWRRHFPAVDLEAEIRKATLWLHNHPEKRRTNIAQFVVNWLRKAQDQRARGRAAPQPGWMEGLARFVARGRAEGRPPGRPPADLLPDVTGDGHGQAGLGDP